MSNFNESAPKIFGLRKKLLLMIIPLFTVTFAVVAILIFNSSRRAILGSSEQTIVKEADSNKKTFTLDMINLTGKANAKDAYADIRSMDSSLQELYNSVAEITVMDGGYAFLINTETDEIVAHPDPSLMGTKLSGYGQGSFMGAVAAQIAAGRTDLFSPADGRAKYYAVVSYVDDTPLVLVSCIDRSYIISADLAGVFFTVVGVLAVALAAVIAIVSIFLGKTIRPITSLTEMMISITDGDFTVRMENKGNDEIALMCHSLNDFVGIMRNVIKDIRDISDQLNDSSKSTKQIAQALSQSADDQSDSMSDVKVTLEQIAAGIQELALHATTLSDVVNGTNEQGGHAKENMRQTVEVASHGRRDMEEVNSAMDSIVESMGQLESIVEKVESSTEQINAMVDVISNISEQTNLLSLNAAIEAARAGDAGRGFAVVAEEIRKLAEVSSSSAAQISDTINQVNSQISYMVQQTSQSVTYIRDNSGKISASRETFERIYRNVADTDRMLTEIVRQISHVDDVATNIAALSQEQSANTDELLATTEELANSSLHFSKDSRQVTQSTDHVSDASFALAEHMRKFKI